MKLSSSSFLVLTFYHISTSERGGFFHCFFLISAHVQEWTNLQFATTMGDLFFFFNVSVSVDLP